MTNEELATLAQDILDGKVFTSNHLPQDDPMMLGMVFMPLVMMDDTQQAEFINKNPGMVYEYLTEAAPMGVNGYPSFMSMRFVTVDEYTTLRTMYESLKAAKDAALQTATNAPSV